MQESNVDGAFDDNYVWCCAIMMFPPLLKPTPLSERGEENSRILVCCCTWLVFKMNLKASTAGAFYIELWNIYSWLSQFGCYWKSEALSSAEDGLQDLARADLNNSDTNFDNRDKTLLTCLNLKSPCNWGTNACDPHHFRPNIYLWSQIYVPEAWGSGAPRVAGSRISFPFPLAPALFAPAGMKFEESLNIGSRDGEGL